MLTSIINYLQVAPELAQSCVQTSASQTANQVLD